MVVSSILLTGGYKNFFCYNIASLAACNSVGKALDSWRSALCQRFWVFQGVWGLTGEKKESLRKNSALLLRLISNQIRSKNQKVQARGVKRHSLSQQIWWAFVGSRSTASHLLSVRLCHISFQNENSRDPRLPGTLFPELLLASQGGIRGSLHPWVRTPRQGMPSGIQHWVCEDTLGASVVYLLWSTSSLRQA